MQLSLFILRPSCILEQQWCMLEWKGLRCVLQMKRILQPLVATCYNTFKSSCKKPLCSQPMRPWRKLSLHSKLEILRRGYRADKNRMTTFSGACRCWKMSCSWRCWRRVTRNFFITFCRRKIPETCEDQTPQYSKKEPLHYFFRWCFLVSVWNLTPCLCISKQKTFEVSNGVVGARTVKTLNTWIWVTWSLRDHVVPILMIFLAYSWHVACWCPAGCGWNCTVDQ